MSWGFLGAFSKIKVLELTTSFVRGHIFQSCQTEELSSEEHLTHFPQLVNQAGSSLSCRTPDFLLQHVDSSCHTQATVVRGLSLSCSMYVGFYSPTRDQTRIPCIAWLILNHWTTGEVHPQFNSFWLEQRVSAFLTLSSAL